MRWPERTTGYDFSGGSVRAAGLLMLGATLLASARPWQLAERLGGSARGLEAAAIELPSYAPLSSGFALSILPWAALAALCAFALARLAGKIRESWGEQTPLGARDEEGSAVVQFLLLLPILLIFALLILQVALIVQAKFVVNYAAFNAVRSAVVWIPAKTEDEARNRLDGPGQSDKREVIRRAAALPCVAISPGASVADETKLALDDHDVKEAMERVYGLFPVGDKLKGAFLTKAQYAFHEENTRVDISAPAVGDEYGANEEITVTVTHRYYLIFPLVGRLLGTKFQGGTASFANITEQYTLFNQGEAYDPNGEYDKE